MPQKYEVTATCATPDVTRLELALNGTNVPLDADADGNFSADKNITLPESFQGDVKIRMIGPAKWTVSIEVLTIPDGTSLLKKDITGTIKEADRGRGEWSGPLTLTPPAANNAALMLKMPAKKAAPAAKTAPAKAAPAKKAPAKTATKGAANAKRPTSPRKPR